MSRPILGIWRRGLPSSRSELSGLADHAWRDHGGDLPGALLRQGKGGELTARSATYGVVWPRQARKANEKGPRRAFLAPVRDYRLLAQPPVRG